MLTRSSHILSRSFADETLVASPSGGEVDRFTASAAAVWDLLEEPRSFDDLISIVGATYGVPAKIVAHDVEPFVCALIDRGWVLEVGDVDD